ncbi:type II toxin-antitoxin system RelE/ParE family toxin [Desulfonema magnum]|uniref:DUF891 n=1 Tax=Desulfonema magnum TaxID=45655 RepID=A0A975GUW9_9BACT|nr:type II toxin-antitoxin system RelE/ParE family toxin [Desulfonema magnum]QTA93238.1 DUF891 [Desulfonema magnum]
MNTDPILSVIFFKSLSGREPVREWLKELDKDERKIIGEVIKLVQFRWPLGMPVVRKIDTGLWEVRIHLDKKNHIARVFFTVHAHEMILLHGFIKKSQKTPLKEINLARKRKIQYLREVK